MNVDVLLSDTERKRLRAWIADRRDASSVLGETWAFGPISSGPPPAEKPFSIRIEAELRRAGGSDHLKHPHLRHSFASYLLATMLLPQDVAEPAVPPGLTSVISPARFQRVADRLLGYGRLGASSLHAVSQLMGHTGPGTTLRSYCHLLDLSLALYCGRPSSMAPIKAAWLADQVKVGPDARRKVGRRRQTSPAVVAPDAAVKPARNGHERRTTGPAGHKRPDAATIASHVLSLARGDTDVRLLTTGADRFGRPLERALRMQIEETLRLGLIPAKAADPGRVKTGKRHRSIQRVARPYVVPWRAVLAASAGTASETAHRLRVEPEVVERWRRNAECYGLASIAVPADTEAVGFIDARLSLARRPRKPETNALQHAVLALARHREVRVKRLGDARAFVRLLGVMGFAPGDVVLKLTSGWVKHLSSEQVHAFFAGDGTAYNMSGRWGWRGSLIVRFRPVDAGGPVTGQRACWFTLMMLAIFAETTH